MQSFRQLCTPMAKYGQMRRNRIEATYKPGMVGPLVLRRDNDYTVILQLMEGYNQA